jgi:hypothetical protein
MRLAAAGLAVDRGPGAVALRDMWADGLRRGGCQDKASFGRWFGSINHPSSIAANFQCAERLPSQRKELTICPSNFSNFDVPLSR